MKKVVDELSGITWVEVMIIAIIIAVLAVIAIPNFIAMENRKKEGYTKANMHAIQLAMEDWGVEHDGCYPESVTELMSRVATVPANPWRDSPSVELVTEPDTARIIPRGVVRVGIFLDENRNASSYRVRGGNHANQPLLLKLSNEQ